MNKNKFGIDLPWCTVLEFGIYDLDNDIYDLYSFDGDLDKKEYTWRKCNNKPITNFNKIDGSVSIKEFVKYCFDIRNFDLLESFIKFIK